MNDSFFTNDCERAHEKSHNLEDWRNKALLEEKAWKEPSKAGWISTKDLQLILHGHIHWF